MNLLSTSLLLLVFYPISSQFACPGGAKPTDIQSDSITIGIQSSISIQPGIDNKCYNYTLSSSFPRPPNVAIAINQFQAYQSNDLFFAIKPLTSMSSTVISFVIRTPWKLTNWTSITVNFLAQARLDVQAGYIQKDTGLVGGCGLGKTQPLFIPFTEQWLNIQNLKAHVFLNGFQITTLASGTINSPYEIQLLNPTVNQTGLIVILSVTTTTQINNVYLSYFIFNPGSTSMNIAEGFSQKSNIQGSSLISLSSSAQSFGSIRSGIYGFSGFIINSNNVPQLSIIIGQNLSAVINTFGGLYNYIGFQYVIVADSPCFNCQNYPYLYNNTCVPTCPSNTVPTGYSCQSCPKNSFVSNSRCICTEGFYNISGSCTTCPSNMRWNGTQCVGCGNNAIWSGNVCTCVTGYYNISGICQSCSGGQQWNGMNCVPISNIINQQSNFIQNQNQQPIYQQTQQTQTQTQSTTPTNNGASSCPAGVANWNGQTCVCILSGFTWNGTSCVQRSSSSTQSSTTSTLTNPSQSGSQNCPPGISVWNGQQCICNQQGYYFNGQTCISNPSQTQPSQVNQYTQSQQYQTSTSQNQNQLQNQLPNQYQGQNQFQNQNINQGQNQNINQGQTQTQTQTQSQSQSCPSGAIWNGQQCICNQQGYYFNGQACIQGNSNSQGTQSSTQQQGWAGSSSSGNFGYSSGMGSSQSGMGYNSGISSNGNQQGLSSSVACPSLNMSWNGISCVCNQGYVLQGSQCIRGY